MRPKAPSNGGHLLRIHAVAELTGVPEATLRAWERRYGIPVPLRSPSGYRLFGPREIDQVREMRRLCDAGVSAAEAADVVRTAPGGMDRPPTPTSPGPLDELEASASALVEAVVRFDDAALERALDRATALGPPVEVLHRVLKPALVSIGALWESGAISVAQEHLASHRIGTVMREALRLLPGSSSERQVLLACFADDEHELGLIGVAIQLSSWGFRPVLLGPRTPPSAVRFAVDKIAPCVVGLSLTVAPSPARLRELCDDYASACGSVPWLVGGAAGQAAGSFVTERGGILVPNTPEALRRVMSEVVPGSLKRVKPRKKSAS